MLTKPKLIIPKHIEERLNQYVQSVPSEIAGMGAVEYNQETGEITVTEIAIYEQKVTGGTADLSSEALAKFQMDLIKAGKSPSKWRLWWHSHNDMQAFFSGTDTGTIDGSDEFDWLVSLVVNKRRDREARMDTYRPFRLTHEDMEIVVEEPEPELCPTCHREVEEEDKPLIIPDDIREEVKAKVEQKSFRYTPSSYQPQANLGFGAYSGYDLDSIEVPPGHKLTSIKHMGGVVAMDEDGDPYIIYQSGYKSYNITWDELSRMGKLDDTANESDEANDDVIVDTYDLSAVSDPNELRRYIAGITEQMRIYEQTNATDDDEYSWLKEQLVDAQARLTELTYGIN